MEIVCVVLIKDKAIEKHRYVESVNGIVPSGSHNGKQASKVAEDEFRRMSRENIPGITDEDIEECLDDGIAEFEGGAVCIFWPHKV